MSRFRALVVDDSPAMRTHVAQALARLEGFEVEEAEDGADGWRRLQSGVFHLLVTDINMPVMDGLKLVSLVRGTGAHRAIPIVVVTTESAEADRKRAIALGANDYLVKPVQAQAVLDTVRNLLRLPE